MIATVFEVRRGVDGDWRVFREDLGNPLSAFADKHDAIEFASGQAGALPAAEIHVIAADGTLLGARPAGADAGGIWD